MKNLIQIGLLLWLLSSAAAQAQPGEKALRIYDWKEVNPPHGFD